MPLPRPQRQHRLAHPRRARPANPVRRQAPSPARRTAAGRCGPSAVERELDLEHHRVGRVLQHAGAVAEAQRVGCHPALVPGATVEQPDAADDVGDLDAVGADVLHGRRPRRPGDARQALQPAQPVRQRRDDDVVPQRARLGAHDVAVDGDLGVGQADDGEVGRGRRRCTTLEPPASTSTGSSLDGQRAQHVDDLVGGVARDQPPRDRPDPQRGQRRERHGLLDRNASDIRTRPRAVTVAWPAMPRSFDMAADYDGSVEQIHRAFGDERYWLAATGRFRRRRDDAGLDRRPTRTAAST